MKITRILLILLSVVVILVISAIAYVKMGLPNVPLKEVTVTSSPDRIANGKYLANNVMVCMDCHSARDWSRFSAPLVEGTLGKGGELFDQNMGFPGRYVSRNITPFNLADWSDAELFRVITSGVTKSGKAIFPVMPYHYYGGMDEEDIKDVIAYLRTLEPINYAPEESVSDFPMNFIINTMPKTPVFTKKPKKEVSVLYGKYLVNSAGCVECHTPFDGMALEMDKAFSGGRVFPLPNGSVTTPNLTPHATGIGKWSQDDFIARFKSYDMAKGYQPPLVQPGEFNTIMPWTMYAGMDEIDLAAIYSYLQSLEPIENKVEVFVAQK
jgi:mono/diheme cytochrome c family protein